MEADERKTIAFGSANQPPRKRAARDVKPGGKSAKARDRVSVNLTLGRKARILLAMHASANRGTSKGTASALVEALILGNLKWLRAADQSPETGQDADAESA